MHRPPVLDVADLQEKNTFIHVPETPMSTVPIPLRTTPASFAPPNVFQQQRKRPDTINTVPETGVASGSATQQVLPAPVGKEVTALPDNHALITPQYTVSPSRPNYYGETPTTMKAATNLKLADFVATPKAVLGETGGSPKPHVGGRPNPGSSNQYHQANQQYGSQGFSQGSAVGRPSHQSHQSHHSGGQPGGYLPMLNSSLVSGPAPTTQVSIQPVPDVSWCQNVEVALAAESAKISAPYTGVGKSLTRAIF